MITLEQASERVGQPVTYLPKMESGVIQRVGIQYVFVAYPWGVAATDPRDLELGTIDNLWVVPDRKEP